MKFQNLTVHVSSIKELSTQRDLRHLTIASDTELIKTDRRVTLALGSKGMNKETH